jgi:hypothetical protein
VRLQAGPTRLRRAAAASGQRSPRATPTNPTPRLPLSGLPPEVDRLSEPGCYGRPNARKTQADAVHCRDEPAATGLCQQVPNALLIIASSQARALHRSRHQVHAELSAGARWPERSARRLDSHSRLGTWSRKLRSNRPGVAQELRTTTDCHLAWPVGTLGTTPIRHCPSVALSVPDHFF